MQNKNIKSLWGRISNKIYTMVVQPLKERHFSYNGQLLRYMFFRNRKSDILLIGFQACNETVYIHYSDQEHTYQEHIKELLKDLKKQGINIHTNVAKYAVHEDLKYYYPAYLKEIIHLIQKE